MTTRASTPWTCPRCGRQFLKPKQSHSCQVRRIDDHFTGRDPALRSLFDRLCRALERRGPLRVDALQTSIHLVSGHHFGGIRVRRDHLKVEFLARGEIRDARIERVERLGPRRVAHHVVVRGGKDVDAKLLEWLAEAQAMQAKLND